VSHIRWTPETELDYDRLKGLQVISCDGERLGRISKVVPHDHTSGGVPGERFFVFHPSTRKEWFGGVDDVYLPESAMIEVPNRGVEIEFSESEIRQRRWHMPKNGG